MMTDADFIREVQSCERTLYRVSRTILSSDADCCDAVQEALTRAWKHRNDVNPSFFKTWLVRILINECHNIGRRLKRVTPVDKIPDQPVWQAEETGMMEALQNIKESWRIVLTMHELEGFTYSEIAAVTHTPESTVKYRAVQARRALRREIEKQENELKDLLIKVKQKFQGNEVCKKAAPNQAASRLKLKRRPANALWRDQAVCSSDSR